MGWVKVVRTPGKTEQLDDIGMILERWMSFPRKPLTECNSHQDPKQHVHDISH